MLISQKMNDAITAQIGREFGALLQYVAITAHFEVQSLPRLAKHFSRQATEERDHAMRFIKYLIDAGAAVVIPSVAAPKSTFATAEEAAKPPRERGQRGPRPVPAILGVARQG